jgi:hypothetical protein
MDSPSKPAVRVGRLPRWAAACAVVAAAACAAAPATGAGAPGRFGGGEKASKGLVSLRYQAVGCDTAAAGGRAPRQLAAVASGASDPAVHRAIPATTGRFAARESGRRQLRYRLHDAIPHYSHAVSQAISTHQVLSAPESCRRIAASIAPMSFETSIPSDGRRLFQLAVAFALAYVVFLTVWFWSTRERRSRVGRAARS